MIRSPDVMSSSPAIIRRVVDFPHPDGPTKTMNSFFVDTRLKEETAFTSRPFFSPG